MKCPFELPVRSYKAMNMKYCVCEKDDNVLFNCLTEDQANFLIQAINSHEKLVKQIEGSGFVYNHAINMTPTGNLRNKLTEMNIERLQALKETEKKDEHD